MTKDELAFVPALELLGMIARREVSPVEVTELFLERIERLDGSLNSYLTVTRELALQSAREAEAAVMRGDDLGPLHGVPVSIKDLEMTAGVRTTSGSLLFKDRVPDKDSAVDAADAGGGGDHAGEDEHAGVRAAGSYAEPAGRPRPEPVEHGPDAGRVERRRGGVVGGRAVHGGIGERRRGLDQDTFELLRSVRNQADPGPGAARNGRADAAAGRELVQPVGSDDADGPGRGDVPAGAGGP